MNNEEASKTYRDSHKNSGYGLEYDAVYRSGYYGAHWAYVERPLVRSILSRFLRKGDRCLDFACGTGRLTRVACEFSDHVTGVDVSPAMLKANSCSDAVLYCHDITQTPLGETFDVVLSFRFFLNAEERLRREALCAINKHHRSGGVLIANIHMLSGSPMGLIYRILKKIIPWKRFHEVLSEAKFRSLLANYDYEVVEICRYGYFPRLGPYFPALSAKAVPRFERLALALGVPDFLAQSAIFIAIRR